MMVVMTVMTVKVMVVIMPGSENDVVAPSQWNGFKIVGDNLDKNITPRFMRCTKQTRSLHYFNVYAVKDRIDLSSLSSYKHHISIDVEQIDILPSKEIHAKLMHNIVIIVFRILVDNLSAFKLYFEDVVERHIVHEYSCEMSKKSEVVS